MTDLTELAAEVLSRPLNQDVARYLVLCRYPNNVYEWRDRDDADCDQKTTLAHIYSGEIERVHQVIEINVSEGTCRDVSDSFARMILAMAVADCEKLRPDLVDFCEDKLGIMAVNGLRRAA